MDNSWRWGHTTALLHFAPENIWALMNGTHVCECLACFEGLSLLASRVLQYFLAALEPPVSFLDLDSPGPLSSHSSVQYLIFCYLVGLPRSHC